MTDKDEMLPDEIYVEIKNNDVRVNTIWQPEDFTAYVRKDRAQPPHNGVGVEALNAINKLQSAMSKEIPPNEKLSDLYNCGVEDVLEGDWSEQLWSISKKSGAFIINNYKEIEAFYKFAPFIHMVIRALSHPMQSEGVGDWKTELLRDFPFEHLESDDALARCFVCQDAGLLNYRDTETDAEREEYGQSMFELTAEGEKLLQPVTAQPNAVDGELLKALRHIREHTDADQHDSYRCEDREGCLDTVYALADEAIQRAGAGQKGGGFEKIEGLEDALKNSIFVQNGCRPIMDAARAYLKLQEQK